MNIAKVPVHTNSNYFNISNDDIYPEPKKVIVGNNYDKVEINKTGFFKRDLSIVAVNTKYTYSDTDQRLNPQFVVASTRPLRLELCQHPQELLYRDRRGVCRKIVDMVTGRKDYDLYLENSRDGDNALTVVTTKHREMFPETTVQRFKVLQLTKVTKAQ